MKALVTLNQILFNNGHHMKKIFYALPLLLSTANSYAVDARSYNI